MQGKTALIDKLEIDLFADESKINKVFDKDEVRIVKRIRYGFTIWLDNPIFTAKDMREKLIQNFGISEQTAYRDIPIIQHLVGNMKQASKEFMRKRANHMVHEGYKLAEDAVNALEVKKAEALIKAGMALVKINKLDKEDILPYAWDDIKPVDYEITDDVSVLDLEPIAKTDKELEALKQRLRNKYAQKTTIITEAKIISDETKDLS